jgi:hypothetical protein
MRRFSVLVLSSLLALVMVPSVRADDFANFRIPKHQVSSITGNASAGYWERVRSFQGTTDRTEDFDSHLNGSCYWLWDSDSLRLLFEARESLSGMRSRFRRNTDDFSLPVSSDYASQSTVSNTTALSADGLTYPTRAPLGLLASVSSYLTISKGWTFERQSFGVDTVPELRSDYSYVIRSINVDASIGIGWGRVRDASAVYDLFVMENRLRDAGILVHALSPDARQKLLALLYFEGDYSNVHQRPAKFVWQEIENIFREDGALKDNRLDAYELYRIAEPFIGSGSTGEFMVANPGAAPGSKGGPIYRRSFLRQKGWFVSAVVSGSHYHDFNKWDVHATPPGSGTEGRTIYEHASDFFSVGPQIEYHLPVGLNWQVDASSSVAFPQRAGAHAIRARAGFQAAWLISDRWQAVANFSYSRDRWRLRSAGPEDPDYPDAWSTELSGSLIYFIEDRLSLNLNLADLQSTMRISSTPISIPREFDRNSMATIGLAYHFLGKLEAPGIVSPSTLMPFPR